MVQNLDHLDQGRNEGTCKCVTGSWKFKKQG